MATPTIDDASCMISPLSAVGIVGEEGTNGT